MKVYDFDKTIFDGDSTAGFFLYCLRRRPALLRFLPGQGLAFLRLALGLVGKTACKQRFYRFFRGIPDIDALVADFWALRMSRVKGWYLAQRRPDDTVISASPEFLLRPACDALGVGCLIASRVDRKTGVYTGENCHGGEKVARFREVFGDAPIEEFYSDSLSDAPLADLAGRAFLVDGDRLLPWPR